MAHPSVKIEITANAINVFATHSIIENRDRSTSVLPETSNCKQRLVRMKHDNGADGLSIQELHFSIEKQSHFPISRAGFFVLFTTCFVAIETTGEEEYARMGRTGKKEPEECALCARRNRKPRRLEIYWFHRIRIFMVQLRKAGLDV